MVPVPFAAAALAGPATPRTSPDAMRSSGSSHWPSVRSTVGRGLVDSMTGPPVVRDIVDLTISIDCFIRGQRGPNHREEPRIDRKSTRLNSSHLVISYAV